MMNLYREVEEDKPSLIERIKSLKEDIRLNFATSSFVRKKTLKSVTNRVKSLDSNNIQEINAIYDAINRLDLFDARYGKQLDYNVFKEFVSKVEKNPEAQDILKSLKNCSVCYKNEQGVEAEREA